MAGGVVGLVLVTIVSLKTVTLILTTVLCITSGGFTICRSPQVTRMKRILPRTGYNKYNCPNYDNFTSTYIGTNSLSKGFYPMNKRPIVTGVTSVLKLMTKRTRPVMTIIEYGKAYTGHPHVGRCSNTGDYTVTTSLCNKRANYDCNYLNYNSYITTYRFSTVRVGPRAKLPRISRTGYATYNTYIGTYPGTVVRVHPRNGGSHHICISYIGGSGNTITHGTYAIDYVNYKGYIGAYPFRTVALRGGLTCVSPSGYGSYQGYIRMYPRGAVVRLGFPPHGPGRRTPTTPGRAIAPGRATRTPGMARWWRGGVRGYVLGAFSVNKIRPRRGGLSTRRPVVATRIPTGTIVLLNRRVNTPTGPIITGKSIMGMNAQVTRPTNFISTTVRSSIDNGITGVSAVISTDNCTGPTVFVSIRNSR